MQRFEDILKELLPDDIGSEAIGGNPHPISPTTPPDITDKDLEELDKYAASHYLETSLNTPLLVPAHLPPPIKIRLQNLHAALTNPEKTKQLRPSQVNVLNQYCNGLMEGKMHAVIPMATGTGKTVVFTHLLNFLLTNSATPEATGKALVTTSTRNLVDQIIARLKQHGKELKNPPLRVAQWGDLNWWLADIIVTTDQKVRITNLDETVIVNGHDVPIYKLFDIAVIDEAHKSLGKKGVQTIQKLMANGVTILPVTATPIYGSKQVQNEEGLHSCYELINTTLEENSILPYGITAAVDAGDLAPVRSAIVNFELDAASKSILRNFKGEDINEEYLGSIINTETLRLKVVNIIANGTDTTGERFLGMQSVIFCAGVSHAEDVAAEINKHIKVDGNKVLEEMRAAYVARVEARMKREGGVFDRTMVQNAFKVAAAIHGGKYSITLSPAQIKQALTANKLNYTDPRTGEFVERIFTEDERKELLKKEDANKPIKFTVGRALSLQNIKQILQQYDEGGFLKMCGALMVSTGWDPKDLELVINLRGTCSAVCAEQRAGRALRTDKLKPNKVAKIIDVNLGMRDQVFFYDITGGHMHLGEQNQPKVDHTTMPKISIPGQPDTVELNWGEEIIAVIDHANGKAPRKSARTAGSVPRAPKDIQLEDLISGILTTMENIKPKLNLLEQQLQQCVAVTNAPIRKKATLTFFAHGVPKPEPKSQTPTTVQTNQAYTRLQDSRLTKINHRAAEMVERLNMIIEAMAGLADDEIRNNESTKRRKRETETVSNDTRVVAPEVKPISTLTTMQSTLQQLKTMRNKLQQLTRNNICHTAPHCAARDDAVVIQRDEKQIEIEELIEEISGVSDFIKQAQEAIDVSKLQAELQQAKERKQQAELKHKQAALKNLAEKPIEKPPEKAIAATSKLAESDMAPSALMRGKMMEEEKLQKRAEAEYLKQVSTSAATTSAMTEDQALAEVMELVEPTKPAPSWHLPPKKLSDLNAADLFAIQATGLMEGDPGAALDNMNKAIELEPNALRYYRRALIKQHLKYIDGAIGDCMQAIKLAPDFEEARQLHANLTGLLPPSLSLFGHEQNERDALSLVATNRFV